MSTIRANAITGSGGSGGLDIQGTNTNDNAAAGDVGEYVSGSGTIGISTGTSGQFQNITSISLTAGDWDISALSRVRSATTGVNDFQLAISINSGNTTTDHVSSDNVAFQTMAATNVDMAVAVPPYRLSIASTTTVYLKCYFATIDNGTQVLSSYIKARRVR